uniref:Receptor activity-modifying protein 3 n=1 Tax=Anas platyrhynchos platyrhynchos TaxID=8840 RepID=A0A493TC41_ANAPP
MVFLCLSWLWEVLEAHARRHAHTRVCTQRHTRTLVHIPPRPLLHTYRAPSPCLHPEHPLGAAQPSPALEPPPPLPAAPRGRGSCSAPPPPPRPPPPPPGAGRRGMTRSRPPGGCGCRAVTPCGFCPPAAQPSRDGGARLLPPASSRPAAVGYYDIFTQCTEHEAFYASCFWPNPLVEGFITRIHKQFFLNCTSEDVLWEDPPDEILITLILIPVMLTCAMITLVVWCSKRSDILA